MKSQESSRYFSLEPCFRASGCWSDSSALQVSGLIRIVFKVIEFIEIGTHTDLILINFETELVAFVTEKAVKFRCIRGVCEMKFFKHCERVKLQVITNSF